MVARRKLRRKVRNPTRYARETGTRLPRWREKLAAYEADGGYFVHFSNFPKLGINPTNKYGTPTGFYAYPLNFASIADFATNRPYAIVFRTGRARVWVLARYNSMQYLRDVDRLIRAIPSAESHIEEWASDATNQTHAGRMWNITRMAAGENVARWTRILYSVLGYDGVVDDCLSIIHESEKCQAVFFDVRTLELVDILRKGETRELRVVKRENLSGHDLSKQNIGAANLRGALMVRTNLRDASLEGADLRSAKLVSSNLRGARFVNADMRDANLSRSDMTDAVFSYADLSGVNFRGAKFRGAEFRSADLHNANLKGMDLRGAWFNETNLRGADMMSADLQGTSLINANISYASLRNANLRRSALRGADLQGTDLRGADIRGADMRHSDTGGKPGWGTHGKAKFSGAIYDDATQFPDGFDMDRLI